MCKPFTLLLTGLSGSGKSTLARSISSELIVRGIQVEVLDGDVVRDEIGHLFGYARDERLKVSKILRFMAKTLNRKGISVIIAAITPYKEMRANYRDEISDYIEVYVKCPIEVCIDRDVKGLYRKALRGDVKHVIGIDEAFEIPNEPEIVLDTSRYGENECFRMTMEWLENRGYA